MHIDMGPGLTCGVNLSYATWCDQNIESISYRSELFN